MPTDFLADAKPVKAQQNDFLANATPVTAPVPTTGRLNMPMHQAEAIQQQNQPLQATSKRNELGSIFPTAGMTVGGLLGSVAGPVGTSLGGAYGGVVGEAAKAKFEGNKMNPLDAVESGALGGLGGPFEELPGALGEIVPTRAKAGRLFEDVMSKAADQPVTLSPQTMEPLERTQQLASAGGKPFGTADKLYQRINQTQPLSYGEARDFAMNMSLSPEEKMGLKKSMRYEVPRLSQAFNRDVGNAAAAAGKGTEYDRAMQMYSRASRNAAAGNAVLKYGGRGALGAIGAGGLYELGKELKQ